MSEKSRTPGPWLVDGSVVYTLNDRGVNHMYMRIYTGDGGDEEAANVALVASAPYLLDFAEWVARTMPSDSFIVAEAKRIIAKAKP